MLRKPAILVLLVLLVSPLASFYRAAPARAEQGFADPAFARLWDRTDSLVASNQVTNRSWYWGPGPGVAGQEPYAQAPGGMRRVQYFDKARMEINHPDADPNSPWYVTTGLLVEDMVSGQMQVGDAQFVNRGAATIVVAGDADDSHAPTYASFRGVTSLNNTNRAPRQLGARVTSTINRAGQAGVDVTKAQDDGARIIAYNDVFGHNIPSAIWEFMNQAGVVNVDGQPVVDRPVMNWIFTIGYPISEAYWARVKVAGQPTDVLIQLFERRVLVYIPSFRAPWNVQMANVGIHYYQWLYGANGGPPPAGTPVPTVPPTNPPPTQRPTPIPPPPTFPVPTLPPSPAPPTATPGPGVPPSVGGDVSPLLGPAGTIFTVNVNGFQPHEPVAAWLTAPRGTVTVLTLAAGPGSDGQIRGISVNSAGFQNGVWALTVAGANSKHQSIVFFRVGTPPPPPPPPTSVPPTSVPPTATSPPGPPPTSPPAPTATTPPAQGPLTVSPSDGTAGTNFTFVGTGFQPGEQVALWFVDPSDLYWYPNNGRTLTATSSGQASIQIIPNQAFYDVRPGTWSFHLHGLSSSKDESVQFTIH